MQRILCIGASLLVAACATAPPAPADRVGLQSEPDTCGARSYAQLMGSHATAAPRIIGPRDHRIATLDAVLSADLRPTRINVFVDPVTHRIVGIKCG